MDLFDLKINQLVQSGRKRTLKVIDQYVANTQNSTCDKLIFCSNDYLGLSKNKEVIDAAKSALLSFGTGSGASRLVSGNSSLHQTLEEKFATFVNKDAAVLFGSGYQANVGTISSITDKNDIIFSDELSHASIIDGCRLSKAQVVIYKHCDTAHLRELLKSNTTATGNRFIITEGIFSMDGDQPPLKEICELAEQFNALVYLDEAHSMGIIGSNGAGLASRSGLTENVAFIVGTFGKAAGSAGAALACSRNCSEYLKSTARSMIYSTAIPSYTCAASLTSLNIIEGAGLLRERLFNNILFFKTAVKKHSLPLLDSDSPIQPVIIGDESETMNISQQLWNDGLFVQGIRPPTVKEGSSRLRITITASHTQQEITYLVDLLGKYIK